VVPRRELFVPDVDEEFFVLYGVCQLIVPEGYADEFVE
jgi:hypothetical protein